MSTNRINPVAATMYVVVWLALVWMASYPLVPLLINALAAAAVVLMIACPALVWIVCVILKAYADSEPRT